MGDHRASEKGQNRERGGICVTTGMEAEFLRMALSYGRGYIGNSIEYLHLSAEEPRARR